MCKLLHVHLLSAPVPSVYRLIGISLFGPLGNDQMIGLPGGVLQLYSVAIIRSPFLASPSRLPRTRDGLPNLEPHGSRSPHFRLRSARTRDSRLPPPVLGLVRGPHTAVRCIQNPLDDLPVFQMYQSAHACVVGKRCARRGTAFTAAFTSSSCTVSLSVPAVEAASTRRAAHSRAMASFCSGAGNACATRRKRSAQSIPH